MEQNKLGVVRITPAHMDIVKELLLLTVMGALIIAGVAVPVISYAAFAFCAAVVLFSNTERGFCILFFLVPFATVFKFSVNSTSNLTYLQLLLVGKAMIQLMSHFNKKALLALIIFVIYVVFGCELNFIIAIKQIMIPMTICCFFAIYQSSGKKVLYYFVFGLLLSGIVALFMESIPNLEEYIVLDRVIELKDKVTRASGLYTDPNYYSLALLMSIAGLLSLFVAKRAGISAVIISVVLVLLGSTTVSKSFLLVLAAAYVYFVISLFLRKRYLLWSIFSAIGLVLFIAIISGRIEIFNNILARLEAGAGDANALTTNRSSLWQTYLEHIFGDDLFVTFFGHGVNAGFPGSAAAHSTILDLLYYYGLIGSVLFVVTCWICLGRGKPRQMTALNVFCWVILFVMSLALSCLMFFDFAFMIILAVVNFRTDYTVKRQDELARE